MDRAATVIVLAKQPRPGRVKTRLQAAFTPEEAAELAGAALTDTLTAVRDSAAARRLLAWDGCADGWDAGFDVVAQPPGSLNDRLTAAFAAAFGGRASGPALLIGMDTPQVTAALLDADWRGADAVLGLSEDGGFWAIGLRPGHPPGIFDGVPMSTDRTGSAQLARLVALGLRVRLLPPLRDVDEAEDAEQIAYDHPGLCFAHTYSAIVDARPVQDTDRLFDRVYAGRRPIAVGPLAPDVGRWRGPADLVDRLTIARCEAPVIDLGCGPGRMVVALTEAGLPAFGVDLSRVAVALSRSRGGPALRRSIMDRLPAEGRWGTALLMDGNIGLGGEVSALLDRCRSLVAPGGLIIAEVDPDPDRHDVQAIVLTDERVSSPPLRWARVGRLAVRSVADRLGLLLVEEWTADGRHFVALRSTR